jgi:hypothetical protein
MYRQETRENRRQPSIAMGLGPSPGSILSCHSRADTDTNPKRAPLISSSPVKSILTSLLSSCASALTSSTAVHLLLALRISRQASRRLDYFAHEVACAGNDVVHSNFFRRNLYRLPLYQSSLLHQELAIISNIYQKPDIMPCGGNHDLFMRYKF